MSNLLVVDDEPTICWGVKRLGEEIGCRVTTASSAEQALQAIDDEPPDVIVLDVRLPGMDGLTAIDQLRRRGCRSPIVVITAHGDLRTAVEAIRNDAFEYLAKPFDLETLERVLKRALQESPRESSPRPQREQVGGLIGRSPPMQELYKRIALAAASNTSVMLSGESGTGKELTARAIHQFSPRADAPFVAVNVASLSETLAESELFGHARGAFTGADFSRVGRLVQADGGTLFLDEVADIPLAVQVKLLRALDHGEVTPVGSNEAVKTDFRVISATHQSLEEQVRASKFRHDLYFRLGGFPIHVPSLRSRVDDLPDLARHFLNLARGSSHGRETDLTDEALVELRRRPWYGNVRELRSAMEHATLIARGGAILAEHLPTPAPPSLVAQAGDPTDDETAIAARLKSWAESKLANSSGDSLYEELLRLVEPPLFAATLKRCHDQCAAAARRLGIHRTTLKKKLDQYFTGAE